ncbi:MAG: DUF2752 domain-containing protein [Lachnospiraceae bacterium]
MIRITLLLKHHEDNHMSYYTKEEDALFQIGWSLIGFFVFFYFLTTRFPIFSFMLPCPFYGILGIYCPGCGGTRAVRLLFQGDILGSFMCHPIVLYTAVIGGWFLLSQTLDRFSKHRFPFGMHYHNYYLWIALGIIVVNFIVKNIFLLFFQIDLLLPYTLH